METNLSANALVNSIMLSVSVAMAATTLLGVLMSFAAKRLVQNKSKEIFNYDGYISKNDVENLLKNEKENRPFEIASLAKYYNQALLRAKISFWFSLFFASVGFFVIIFAFFNHTNGNIADTFIKVVSGAVIDAVSTMFFIQSTNAQKSMSEFFEKLRLDRLNVEAREMMAEQRDSERRDQLRAQLVIKYSGIERLVEGGKSDLGH